MSDKKMLNRSSVGWPQAALEMWKFLAVADWQHVHAPACEVVRNHTCDELYVSVKVCSVYHVFFAFMSVGVVQKNTTTQLDVKVEVCVEFSTTTTTESNGKPAWNICDRKDISATACVKV